jgi:uncharacterized membrane protein
MFGERAELHLSSDTPAIRRVGPADIRKALEAGLDDFRANPTHLVFLGLIYPIVLFVAARVILGAGLPQLLFPLVSGCALLGPLFAVGLYEMSRRREAGRTDVHWTQAFDIFKAPALGSIALLGIVLMAVFLVWLYVAMALYERTLGGMGAGSFGELVRLAFATSEGWTLIVLGNAIGFLFAVGVLMISVVSFPMILDRNVSVPTAVVTSVRAVLANPRVMALWGLVVVVGLVLGALPAFAGLAVVIPVLGHATWHLYRRTVGD